MKIDDLARYGIQQAILDIWKGSKSGDLLPIQEKAVMEGLLDGASMIVSAPTSSGKTFLSEIAAIKQTHNQKKVIYLAPHKAIVWEKYKDFNRKYTDDLVPCFFFRHPFLTFGQYDVQKTKVTSNRVGLEMLHAIARSPRRPGHLGRAPVGYTSL